MSRNRKKKRSGLGTLGVLGALIALAIAYFKCGADFGIGGEVRELVFPADAAAIGDAAVRSDAQVAASDAAVADASSRDGGPGGDGGAGEERCQLRLDRGGVRVGGEPVDVAAAVRACAELGAADLVVTGDASFGEREALRAALEEAGVRVYER